MANINYELLSKKEQQALLKIVSSDNALRGRPTFQEWCDSQKAFTRTATGKGLRVVVANIIIRFGWWISGNK